MNAYFLLMRDSFQPFWEIDPDWAPAVYSEPIIFFSCLFETYPDLDVTDFVRGFVGVTLSDRCGGGSISPRALYDDVHANLKRWKKIGLDSSIGVDEIMSDMISQGEAMIEAFQAIYPNASDIPYYVPRFSEMPFEAVPSLE